MMVALVGRTFAQTFTFSRAVPGPVRDSFGADDIAAIDVPRFDHDVDGRRTGLLVSGFETLGQSDRCRVVAGAWEVPGATTVLHEFADDDGAIVRRALYSQSPRATANALLSSAAHHRIIGAVPGYLRNLGGHVRYRNLEWRLPAALGTGTPDEVLADGTLNDRVLIEG